MSDFKLNCNISPITNKGVRVSFKQKRTYHTPEYETYCQHLMMRIRRNLSHDWKPLEGPLLLQVAFYLRRPKSVKRKFHETKPDLDNLLKPLLDCLQKMNVFKNDSQIFSIHAVKFYEGERIDKNGPGIDLTLNKIESDSSFIDREITSG